MAGKELPENFVRKIQGRKYAIDNSWKGNGGLMETYFEDVPDDFQMQWDIMEQSLYEANEIKEITGNHTIISRKGLPGRIIIAVKRLQRKLLRTLWGWYIVPIFQQQTEYNCRLKDVVSIERELLLKEVHRLETLEESYRQYRQEYEERQKEYEIEQKKCAEKQKKYEEALKLQKETERKLWDRIEALEERMYQKELHLDDEFYHEFEERFRGSREDIIARMNAYIPILREYFDSFGAVKCVDIGSGRGELLDVLKYHGIADCIGVDINERQNEVARANGHTIITQNGLLYLADREEASLDVITGIQLVEHLTIDALRVLLKECFRVLKPGGICIFETPNVSTISVGAATFRLDPSHEWPLHPLFLQFLAENTGFTDVKIVEFNPHELAAGVREEAETGFEAEVKQLVNTMAVSLYGSRDYAVIAVKEKR